jgi:hypothetical protein
MGISYGGVFKNTDVLKVAQALIAYGAEDVTIRFGSDPSSHGIIVFNDLLSEDKIAANANKLPWHREKGESRMMHVWWNGNCGCDYADVTDVPSTMVHLGNSGNAKLIINHLVEAFGGGWIKDEPSEEWVAHHLP